MMAKWLAHEKTAEIQFLTGKIAQPNVDIIYVKPGVGIHSVSTWNFKFILYL